jgi:hypothetical protein
VPYECLTKQGRKTCALLEINWYHRIVGAVDGVSHKPMLTSRSQKIGQKHTVKIANRSFEDVANFRYLGTTLTDQNYRHEEIKRRLNSGNAFYHSVHSLLSSLCCLGT